MPISSANIALGLCRKKSPLFVPSFSSHFCRWIFRFVGTFFGFNNLRICQVSSLQQFKRCIKQQFFTDTSTIGAFYVGNFRELSSAMSSSQQPPATHPATLRQSRPRTANPSRWKKSTMRLPRRDAMGWGWGDGSKKETSRWKINGGNAGKIGKSWKNHRTIVENS